MGPSRMVLVMYALPPPRTGISTLVFLLFFPLILASCLTGCGVVSGAAPAPTLATVSRNQVSQGQTRTLILLGRSFHPGATCDFGSGIAATCNSQNSSDSITAEAKVSQSAPLGLRTITLRNPDGQSTSLAGRLVVNQGVPASPGIQVSISAEYAILRPGGTQQFTANVSGTQNTEVIWATTESDGIGPDSDPARFSAGSSRSPKVVSEFLGPAARGDL